MKKIGFVRFGTNIFLATLCVLVFASTTGTVHADTPDAQVSIAATGQVIVRDAKVVHVTGDTIIAVTTWGAMSITWSVETNGSTRFVPDTEDELRIQMIHIGDRIDFSGQLDASASRSTVRATVVRNVSLQKDTMVQTGTVLSVDVGKHMFIIESTDSKTSVSLAGGTILTRDGNMASLSDLLVGDTVKTFGSLNTITDTISADKVTWKSRAQTVSAPQGGVFAGLISWLRGNRGILSSR